ncbi:MAG: ABC transporter permease [Angustibacter sp.]
MYLAIRSSERGWDYFLEVISRGRTADLIGRSLMLTFLVTACSLILGIGTAWLVARTHLPGRTSWQVALALPLAWPTYVVAFCWQALKPDFEGFSAAFLVLTLCCFPYVYLPTLAALHRVNPGPVEAARSLGLSPWQAFLRVTLRQISPAAAGGGLLVALYVLSDFGAVSLLRYDTFTRAIYSAYRASFDRTQAAILATVLVALTLILVAAEGLARGRDQHSSNASTARSAVRVPLGRWTLPAQLALGLLAASSLGVPTASLLWWTAKGSSAGINFAELGNAAGLTLWYSLLGAALTVLLALPIGIISARYRTPAARFLEQAGYAGHALPGIVVALALVFIGVKFLFPIYQRTPLLIVGYAVLFLPAAIAAVRGSVILSTAKLSDIAQSLGHSPRQVLTRVTIPLATPGIAAGAVLVMLTCMKELPATLLLRPTGADTLASELWAATRVGQFAQAAPYAAVLVLLACIPAALLGPVGRVRRD